MPDRVVFWDIDGTLLAGSLEGGFVDYLRQHGQLSLWRIIGRFVRQVMRVPLPAGYQIKIAYLRHEQVGKIERWMDLYWKDEIAKRMYSDIRQVVAEFNAHGFRQVLLSGTLLPLARRLGEFLGIPDIIAAEPEIVDGRYTGGLNRAHPAGPRKTKYAKEWLKASNLDFFDAVALGNHFGDRDLLGRVMVPIAVNPTDKLRDYAGRMGWPIVERPAEVTRLVGTIVERLKG